MHPQGHRARRAAFFHAYRRGRDLWGHPPFRASRYASFARSWIVRELRDCNAVTVHTIAAQDDHFRSADDKKEALAHAR